jgi:C1A family cysteine protease
MERKWGWIKSLQKFGIPTYIPKTAVAKYPMVKSLICPPVQNQFDEGSCVQHAFTSAMEFEEIENDTQLTMLSRSFPYFNYRKSIGDINGDPGTDPVVEMQQLSEVGTCREIVWPYTKENYAKKPPPEAYSDALNFRIKQYFILNSLNDMLGCMADGWGFVCGISVYQSFEDAKDGIIPIPSRDDAFLGGHMIYVGGGYDRHKKAFKFMNSWGTEWGQGGFGWLPFNYLTDRNLASDFFTIRKV